MKKESGTLKKEMQIKVATKFKKVKFSPDRIVALYKAGKTVAAIALEMGYPPNAGNNRVRNLLMKAGVYKKAAKKKVA